MSIINSSFNKRYKGNPYKSMEADLTRYLNKDITKYIILKYLEIGDYNHYCFGCKLFCKKKNKDKYCFCLDCGKHMCLHCYTNVPKAIYQLKSIMDEYVIIL